MAQQNSASEGTLKTPQPETKTITRDRTIEHYTEFAMKVADDVKIPSEELIDYAFDVLEINVKDYVEEGYGIDEKYTVTLSENVRKTGDNNDHTDLRIENCSRPDDGKYIRLYGWREIWRDEHLKGNIQA